MSRAPAAVDRRTAVFVVRDLPLPVTSGGRKRAVRLIEAAERAGAQPYLLTSGGAGAEGLDEARERGWHVEVVGQPDPLLRLRLAQHARRDAAPALPALSARLRRLAATCGFVQLEEIAAAQFSRDVPGHVRCAVSVYNVDSAVEAQHARDASRAMSLRATRQRYVAARTAATERRAARRADLLICVSTQDRLHFARTATRPPLVVPNGVDPGLFAIPTGPAQEPRVLFFGQFAWRPNADGLRRFVETAWPRVRARCPSARLRIAGPGSREAAGGLAGDSAGIDVLGFVPDLESELAAARMVVAPLWAGGGTRIKVVEALAAARPVVGTALGVEGIGFVHARHGLIAADGPGLADATLQVLADDEAARRFGEEGRELVRRLEWTRVTRPLEEEYARWLAPPPAGRPAISPPRRRPQPATR